MTHMVMVHQSVEHYSEQFAAKLRRKNYTTPKNYLDYIDTYLSNLEKKDKANRNQVYFYSSKPLIILILNKKYSFLSFLEFEQI